MSEQRMSVERARRLMDGGHHTVHTGLVIPAARTIVAQAEQIETLSRLLAGAEKAAIVRAAEHHRIITDLETYISNLREGLIYQYGKDGPLTEAQVASLCYDLTRILEGDTDG